jgi:hypothetical protein
MKFLSRGSKYLVVEKLDTQRLGVGVAGGEKGGVEGPRVDGGLRQLVLPYSSSSSALTEIPLRFHECFPAPMISPRTRISEKRRCISPPLRSGPECVIMMARRWYLPADTRVSGAYGCTVRAICQPRRLNEAAVPRLNMAANTCSSKKSQTGRRSRSIIPISSCAIIRISGCTRISVGCERGIINVTGQLAVRQPSPSQVGRAASSQSAPWSAERI